MFVIPRHQHKVHLLSKLGEANFTVMQQLIANWSCPHATHKIEGSKLFILHLLANKFSIHTFKKFKSMNNNNIHIHDLKMI